LIRVSRNKEELDMKRIGLFVGLIIVGAFLTGCDTPVSSEETQYYYYEFIRISKINYNSVTYPTAFTFSALRTYRDRLESKSVEIMESGSDATRRDLYDFMTSRGSSASEANAELAFLNSVGNNVILFEYAYDNNYYVAVYVEKI
jgi:hypothetical protein